MKRTKPNKHPEKRQMIRSHETIMPRAVRHHEWGELRKTMERVE